MKTSAPLFKYIHAHGRETIFALFKWGSNALHHVAWTNNCTMVGVKKPIIVCLKKSKMILFLQVTYRNDTSNKNNCNKTDALMHNKLIVH